MFRVTNGSFIPFTIPDHVEENLPAGVYSLHIDKDIGFFFVKEDSFILPTKIYGNAAKLADRIFNTYLTRVNEGKSTGVKLEGEKGSGKSLLMKLIACKAISLNMPVILINRPFVGDEFNKLIVSLGKTIIFFDEFEKVYTEKDHQNALLTLLDGGFQSTALFLFSLNDYSVISNALNNRPGRIWYSKKYKGLDKDFIIEYVQDNLPEPEKHLLTILAYTNQFDAFNFDMLSALIQEMKRYDETAIEASEFLGFTKSFSFKSPKTWTVTVTCNDKQIPLMNHTTHYDPVLRSNSFTFSSKLMGKELKAYFLNHTFYVNPADILESDPLKDIYSFAVLINTIEGPKPLYVSFVPKPEEEFHGFGVNTKNKAIRGDYDPSAYIDHYDPEDDEDEPSDA